MKKIGIFLLALLLCAGLFPACQADPPIADDSVHIRLSDTQITVDGKTATTDDSAAVYTAHDIVYYEAGHDFTYGEGTDADAHTPEQAAAHTVVHITQPGRYTVSGTLSKGQLAVDLGKDAKTDPNATVTLLLDNADITCEVAPAVIFYNVYECGSKESDTASATVDTTAAGANVVLVDGSENRVNGAYVARIYEPDSVVLAENGTEVEDADKLHKYDGAFYSKMSMNIDGGEKGDGILHINAANEGLDSELHLTINGGDIRITSGNDGINTNEDEVSVTTVNGGSLNIVVDGKTGEGDGIDSNGWLVINGGTVSAQACATSGDAGIDSDMGIHLNGGTVFATGNMLDRISESKQNFAVFTFAGKQNSTDPYSLKAANNSVLIEKTVRNAFSYLVISTADLVAGDYSLWCGDSACEATSTAGSGFGGGTPPSRPEGGEMTPPMGENGTPPSRPEGGEMTPPTGENGTPPSRPEGGEMTPPMGENGTPPSRPEGGEMTPPADGDDPFGDEGEASTVLTIREGGNYFQGVRVSSKT